MMPTIFVTQNPQKTLEELRKKLLNEGVKPINIQVFETEESIGIAEIRILQSDSYISSAGKKAIIVFHAENLTLPAQNALLKLLEEPPTHLLLYLFTPQLDILLPTIQSRCTIIKEKNEAVAVSENMQQEAAEFLQEIMKANIGERLYFAQKIAKEKSDAILFLDETVKQLHQQLLKKPQNETALLLDSLIHLRSILATTNVNPRLAAEDTLLSL